MLGFGVLGPLEVTGPDGAAVPLAGDRQRALVALLLAHAGRVVGAEQLADAVFADRPPANPAAALHSQVSRLRRLLGPQLVSGPSGYALRVEAGRFDAARFERLLAGARAAPPEAVDLLARGARALARRGLRGDPRAGDGAAGGDPARGAAPDGHARTWRRRSPPPDARRRRCRCWSRSSRGTRCGSGPARR